MLTPEKGAGDGYRLPRRSRSVLLAVLVLLVAVLGGLWWNAQHNQHKAQAALSVAETRADQVARANEKLRQSVAAIVEANHRLLKAGKKPVKVPPSVSTVGPQGETGPQGPGPSNDQVAAAVASYCQVTGACAGHGPTQAQVAAAVASYCDNRGHCLGPTGAPGVTGPQGIQGAQGPGPTVDQVAAAVAGYCTLHNGCQGPAGPKGDPGDQGSQGPVGPKGDTGPAGYPESFTFTLGPFTYVCTDSDGDHSYDCVQQQP